MKKFINPELELIELEEKDVITTSVVIPFSDDSTEPSPAAEAPAKSKDWTNLVWNNTTRQ